MGKPFRRSAKYYDEYYGQILDYPGQCDSLETILARQGLEGKLSILDIACGTGTHCLELARRGHRTVGIDISPEMIDRARHKTSCLAGHDCPNFLVQDMRDLDVPGCFDAAICMFGGFGYITKDKDLARFLCGLSRHLKLGGLFLFEFWNIGGLKDSPYRTWRKVRLEDGWVHNLSESNFDHEESILRISMEYIVVRDGSLAETFVENHDMRIYSLSEIRVLLSTNSFRLVEALDRQNLESLEPPPRNAFRIFAVARRGRGHAGRAPGMRRT